ncbi:MAG: tRNA(Ile)(2)-agmatinylcytidine synthase [Candidatus Bathyarchaeota archaeon]|nr:tRNA(Ile)(2)-agmatinylcytidine synthase [Candidatus Bathyarchaeota archaeon]
MHIGFDDTDSVKGGCTTYLAAQLAEQLDPLGVQFLDYPLLIRLNPNVPWKTRGNGALCLRIKYLSEFKQEIKQVAVDLWEQHANVKNKGTDPGIVFFEGLEVPADLKEFSKRTEKTIVTLREALALIKKHHAEALGYNTCRGIIGSLAAIGETLDCDHTYELIAYRTPENCGTPRKVNTDSIFEMDKQLAPYTFNNVDAEKNRVIITPRGPDPILFGIRGETATVVKKAFELVKPLEPVERWMIFRSNQGTDMHLTHSESIAALKPYSSITIQGTVSQNPKIIPVRHVIFSIKDQTGEVDCAAYEPTGDLRKIARQLLIGDVVEVSGAVRKVAKSSRLTINLEKINVKSLTQKSATENPMCPVCNKRLKSMGKNQGYRCEQCKQKYPQLQKTQTTESRELTVGLYVTSTRSQRHLTKPLRRYGQEKACRGGNGLIEGWHFVRSV